MPGMHEGTVVHVRNGGSSARCEDCSPQGLIDSFAFINELQPATSEQLGHPDGVSSDMTTAILFLEHPK